MLPLSRVLERAAAFHGPLPAVADGDVRLSYGELARRAMVLAGALRARGIEPGDRVAILARNSFRYLEINLACAHAGIVLIPLNVRLAPAEIDRILTVTETKLLLRALPLTAHLPQIVWDDAEAVGGYTSYERLVAQGPVLDQPLAGKPDDIAQIFFTSGTTGEPKGVCLTQRNLITSALDSIIALELGAGDVWFHAPPMFHLVDAFAVWAVTLVGGKHVIAHFEPRGFCPLVARERVTKTSLPPTLLDMIVRESPTAEHDLSSLERISYGGSPMPDAVYRRCTAALGCYLLQAYGITEVSGMVCQQVPRDLEGGGRPNSVGQPVLHVELKVIDADGRPQPVGTIGELAVAGDRVMAGYWRERAATTAAMPNGWYRTGDLGVCDREGHYTIVGRKKDMIISGGENVYPAEVENALFAHPAVAEAAVIGVPSERWGEEVRAIVVLNPGFRTDQDELIEHCRTLIGGYKLPKMIEISPDPLPKSGPGKIARNVLRAPYWNQGDGRK
jgi:long-chain acyl-CoA synthetase